MKLNRQKLSLPSFRTFCSYISGCQSSPKYMRARLLKYRATIRSTPSAVHKNEFAYILNLVSSFYICFFGCHILIDYNDFPIRIQQVKINQKIIFVVQFNFHLKLISLLYFIVCVASVQLSYFILCFLFV